MLIFACTSVAMPSSIGVRCIPQSRGLHDPHWCCLALQQDSHWERRLGAAQQPSSAQVILPCPAAKAHVCHVPSLGKTMLLAHPECVAHPAHGCAVDVNTWHTSAELARLPYKESCGWMQVGNASASAILAASPQAAAEPAFSQPCVPMAWTSQSIHDLQTSTGGAPAASCAFNRQSKSLPTFTHGMGGLGGGAPDAAADSQECCGHAKSEATAFPASPVLAGSLPGVQDLQVILSMVRPQGQGRVAYQGWNQGHTCRRPAQYLKEGPDHRLLQESVPSRTTPWSHPNPEGNRLIAWPDKGLQCWDEEPPSQAVSRKQSAWQFFAQQNGR